MTLERLLDMHPVEEPTPVRPRDHSAPGEGPDLSRREQEVLGLLASGATNAHIAHVLGISVNTVRTHVQNLLRKLGVDRRTKAVQAAAGRLPGQRGSSHPGARRAASRDDADSVVIVLTEGHRVFAEAIEDQLSRLLPTRRVDVVDSVGAVAASFAHGGSPIHVLDDDGHGDAWLDRLKELAECGVPVRPLVLSGHRDVATVVRALASGAQGWISSELPLTALAEATQEVSEGRLYLSRAVTSDVVRELLSTSGAPAPCDDFVDSLSSRQLEILRCLMAGMSRDEIASRLFVSVNTVGSHVQRMMRLTGQHSSLSLVAVARQLGVTPADEPRLSP